MKTKSHITKLYNKLVKDIAPTEADKEKLNTTTIDYVCGGHHVTKTKKIDLGTIPLQIPCPTCGQTAIHMGKESDLMPEQEPTHEWFRPTLEQVLSCQKKPNLLEHFLNGGLDYREIKTELKIV